MTYDKSDLAAFLEVARVSTFAAEARIFGDFTCDDVMSEVLAARTGTSSKSMCSGNDGYLSFYMTDTMAWADDEIASFFGALGSGLRASELVFAVLRPNVSGFDQIRRALLASVEIVRDPRNPYQFAQLEPETGTLRPLNQDLHSAPGNGLDPRYAWAAGEGALAGFLLVETAGSVEELQSWLLALIDRSIVWLDLDEITDLRKIVEDREKWGEAKAAFSALRQLIIGDLPRITEPNEVAICLLCEDAAKLTYNLTWPAAPFDRAAPHSIGPSFARLAETFGDEGWEDLLFRDLN